MKTYKKFILFLACIGSTLLIFLSTPLGVILSLATLPFSIWSIWMFKKWVFGLGIIILLFSIVGFIAIPFLSEAYHSILILYKFYSAIFPSGFYHNWISEPPNNVYLLFIISLILIVYIEVIFYILNKFFAVKQTKNQLLIFSATMGFLSFLYILISYIDVLFPVILQLIESILVIDLVYEFIFTFLPFITIYFLCKYTIEFLFRSWIN